MPGSEPPQPPASFGTADLHVHSAWSDGMATVRQIMAHAAEHTSLDVIAIADHDQVRGALEAAEWCAGQSGAGRRLQAVAASEISAAWGRHVVAYFFAEPYPTQPFPRFRSLSETAARVRDQGGVLSIPHPLSALVPSIGRRTLARALLPAFPQGRPSAIVAVEVCSGVVGGRRAEARLRRLNDQVWRLAPLGCSDAHHLVQVGAAFTRFPGHTVQDLRLAMLARQTEACWGASAPVSLAAHARQNWRSLVVKPARELRGALASVRAARHHPPR